MSLNRKEKQLKTFQLITYIHASIAATSQKAHVPVVVLDDVADRPDSRQVLVDALRTDVMQRCRRSGIAIGAREINSHLPKHSPHVRGSQKLLLLCGSTMQIPNTYSEVDLTATHDVIQEGILLYHLNNREKHVN